MRFDAFGLFREPVADPGSRGLVNVTEACVMPGIPPFACMSPEQYLFWDGIHPSATTHRIIAAEVAGALE